MQRVRRAESYDFSRDSAMDGASKDWVLALLFSLFGLLIIFSELAVAQSRVTNVREGIADDIDKKRRGPLVTVTTVNENGVVKLLVDAVQQNSEFVQYPIQFDFFINRRLFTSQFRSPELPGPIGVDIGPDVATPPFNYAIVAKVLHPNGTYTTVFTGAAFASNLVETFDCSLTIETPASGDQEPQTTVFTANDVTTSQTGNNSLGISFLQANNEDNTEEADLSAAFSISGTDISGSLTITRESGTPTTVAVTGTAEQSDDGTEIVSLDVSSEDELISLSCS